MAYDLFQQSEDDKEKEAAQQSQGVIIGQGSPVVQSGGAAAQPGAPTKSGSYTNLQDYLRANADTKFGSEVTGRIAGEVDKADQATKGFESAYKQNVDQNTVNENKILTAKAKTDAASIVGDASQKDAYLKMRDAQYKGPQSASDLAAEYGAVTGQLNKAQQTAAANTNESGRKAYLDQEYGSGVGNNSYNAGQRKLDNFLIQNTPGSKDAFESLNQRAQQTGSNFETLKNALAGYSDQAKQVTDQTRLAARGAIGLTDQNTFADDSMAAKINKAATDRAKSLNDYRAADEAAIRQAIAAKSLTPEQLSRLGVGTKNYGEDLRNYLTGPGTVDKFGVMTDREGSELDALAQLAGITNPFVSDADKAKIGKADMNALAGISEDNRTKLKNTFSTKQQQYNDFMGGYSFNNSGIASQLARLNIFKPPHASPYDSLNSTLDALSGWIRQNGSNGNAKFSGGPSGNVYYGTVLDVYRNLVGQRDALAGQLGINDVLNTNLQTGGGKTPGDDFAPPRPPDLNNSPVGGSPISINPPEKPMTLQEWIASGNTVGSYNSYLNGLNGPGAIGAR